MKRYLVFAGLEYYPSGGWEDFKACCDTEDEAKEVVTQIQAQGPRWGIADWWHIVDTLQDQIIHQGDFSEGTTF